MIRHLRKIAIINDASPDEVAILSNVTDGPDGASNFGLGDNDEVQRLSIEDNQSIHNRITRSLDIRTLVGTSTEDTNIEGYVSNQTPIYIAGLGLDGFVLIGDRQTAEGQILLVKNNQRADNEVWALSATRDVQPGHDPDTGLFESGFWVGENGLGGYLWGDADGDGVADGWNHGYSSASFSTGQWTLTDDDSGNTNDAFRSIFFPFNNEQLTFSVNIDTLPDSTNYDTDIILRFIDSSNSVISNSMESISSTGRKSVTATTSDNTVRISVLIRNQLTGTGSSADIVISDPALRLGTNSNYTKN